MSTGQDPSTSKSRPGQGPGVLPRDAFALAIGTLTVIPTPPPTAVNPRVAGWAMVIGPVVMIPVAVLSAAAGGLLAHAGIPPTAAGLVTVGLVLALTRAIHADGLADTVDGLGASWDRERALDVMRRGDVGPMGASALIVVLILQATCLGPILARPWGWAVAAVLIAASRAALATGTRIGVPAARPEGLGEAVAGAVPWWRWTLCWTATAAAVLGVTTCTVTAGGDPSTTVFLPGTPVPANALAAVLSALLTCELALAFVVRRLGGITGDVLGALVEIAAVALFLVVLL
ncbi:cobalamin-5'-phosphate synthase [Austwickia chelonae]|uniref:Adenosylcobinamide-GDP ribazoletransferase n=1 Tax=Austwickia chelonae NBRC 105200 TaxID=1184607 RepID=K6UL26_9MICO|nr:adenosylcobinamide-GDP ribazoletransferase [Austwickia chelonae]GAB76881.1 cobalamin synthase [Austwickia chelonae NBRC 105200]SEW31922.1 cobalamin-5'-phosphate synthase [Austwickia chelonae]